MFAFRHCERCSVRCESYRPFDGDTRFWRNHDLRSDWHGIVRRCGIGTGLRAVLQIPLDKARCNDTVDERIHFAQKSQQ
jgi:hypothetical protein